MLEQPETLVPLVHKLAVSLKIPVSVKVRILPGDNDCMEKSLDLYQKLVDAGASLLTIHGRTRLQKGPLTGSADWTIVKRAVEKFPSIPILANGSMRNLTEIRACLEFTKCDGVMCSEALLEYPPIYSFMENTEEKRRGPGRVQITREYLQLAREYPPEQGGQGSGLKCLKAHVHRFLHADLQTYTQIRDGVSTAETIDDLETVVHQLALIHEEEGHLVEEEELSWYVRHGIKKAMEEKRLQAARLEAAMMKEEKKNDDSLDEYDEGVCLGCAMFENDMDDDDGDY